MHLLEPCCKREISGRIPVSTLRLRSENGNYVAPRDFSVKLLLDGEIPYGSSFSIGLIGRGIHKLIEKELKTRT
jgi:hypothetical protein